jgi:hypothetical protein
MQDFDMRNKFLVSILRNFAFSYSRENYRIRFQMYPRVSASFTSSILEMTSLRILLIWGPTLV